MTGRAQGVFQGQISVDRIAQKTDAQMACNTLLLSDDAGFSTKPELEIFADDVICAHGATVTEIDHNHLFYLMARGISEKTARGLLIKAFVAEIVEELDNEKACRGAGNAHRRLARGTRLIMDVKTPGYDIEAIRADFPILSRQVHGKPLVYLDNGASAQKPRQVIDAVKYVYENEYANVHRGLHFLSNAATDAYENAREKVRRFLNAGSVDEIVFTKSATEAINTVAYGWGMPNIGEGRRDRRLDHGAPLQYRTVAFHPGNARARSWSGHRSATTEPSISTPSRRA